MRKMQVLSEANDLVRNGLRQAAIDLLVEYLETNPDSKLILQAVGKTYLLDHQPEKAVFYLQKSLHSKTAGDQSQSIQSEYSSDSFNDHDMDFIDSECETNEDEFFFDSNAQSDQKEEKKKHKRPIIKIAATKAGNHQINQTETSFMVRYKTKKRAETQEAAPPYF